MLLFSIMTLAICSPVLADDLTYTYGGDANWFSQSAVSHSGGNAFQSGAIVDSQSSWMETTVTGPGAIRFWWKVSSESCCDPLRFSIDGTAQIDIRGSVDWQSKAFAVPTGTHTLRWTYSTDGSALNGSNAGWVDQITFTPGSFDLAPPTTTATPDGSGYYPAGQSVTLSCSDGPGSGCAGTKYCQGSGCTPATEYSAPIVLSATTYLSFFSTDAAGNSETVKQSYYNVDTTPPTTYSTLSGGSYSGSRSVQLYCSDFGMGCVSTLYCLGSNCTPTIPYSAPIPITASTVLRYYSTDRAGNSETVNAANYTITPDTTPPATIPSHPSGAYGAFYPYLNCSDGYGSGCAATYYCLGAGCTPTTVYESLPRIADSTDLRFYSQDKSGNSEAVQTVSYVIDKTPPVTSANPPAGTYQDAPIVTLSCSDGSGSGCSQTYYCTGLNCAPSTLYRAPIRLNDSAVLRFTSTDNASNKEAVVTQSYVRGSQPRTLSVPALHPTIQGAIDAAYNGDTVLVAAGTYRENIDFRGKNITVTSNDGADVTAIEGDRTASVVTIGSGETRAAVLNGFSIRNGDATHNGGGIYIEYSSPTITNNKIYGNSGSFGGGIAVHFASPSISNNSIYQNSGNYGGGISLGGDASAEVIGNTIFDNRASSGGGIDLWAAGTPLISGNVIKNNTASSNGGGIAIQNSSTARFIQNLIVNNKATTSAGISAGYNNDSFVNNTIVNNDSLTSDATQNAGVSVGNASFINNVIIGVSGKLAVACNGGKFATFGHNIVYAPSGSPYATGCPDQTGLNGNLTDNPLLSNPALGYYALLSGSPAIDAGNGTAPSLTATDLGGAGRVVDGNGDGTAAVDMGAYEFDPARPMAQLQGVPNEFLTVDNLTLTVSGAGVVSYRYSLDGGAFSDDRAVATPLELAHLGNGRHRLVVVGKNGAGVEQQLWAATAATWVVNTESSDLSFSSGGSAPWFLQPDVTRDGIAYQSGTASSGQTTWLETTVTGPGAIRFWWKLDPGYWSGSLSLSLDQTTRISKNSATDWEPQTMVIPAGSHTLRWIFAPGSYASSPISAAYIDQIRFQPGSDLDVAAPVTSATPAAGTYSTSQSVALSCSDGTGTGCTTTLYCLGRGCTPSTPYSAPITISSATDLRYYSSDTAGNYEEVKTASYSFDTTAPSTSASPGAGSFSGGRDVSLYCGDGGMGCASTYYCLGSNCTPSTPYSSAIAITATTDLRYYSVDSGGNRETVKTTSYTITPDVTPPTTTVSASDGTYRPFSVSLWCSDSAGSGCDATYYCLGTGCNPTTPYSPYIRISRSTDIRFYSTDKSGNSGTIQTVSYSIDADPPTTTPSVASGIYTTPQTVTLSCSDGSGSGCSTTSYCLGRECSASTRYTGPITIDSSAYLRYTSYDAVGNWERIKTERYTILTDAPSTINVPADQATIQGAIDAAHDGDTIVVAPGTYRENIDFKGKAISVTSSNGAESTIIDGHHAGSVVSFASGEWRSSVLDGFTLRNGSSTWDINQSGLGGGVYIRNSSPLIRNNRITGNLACSGGGISASGGAPLILGNLLANNSQAPCGSVYGGGGIFLNGTSAAEVIDNTIRDNSVNLGDGGGILATYADEVTIRGNTIRNNTASGNGGGIAIVNSSAPMVVQNAVAGNRSAAGGGIYWSEYSSGNVRLVNNTITGNDAASGGGILAVGYNDEALVVNNIITAKSGQMPVQCETGSYSDARSPSFNNNLVFASEGPTFGGTCGDENGVHGNLSADPLLPGAEFGYSTLSAGSPAIDAGDGGAPLLPETDLGGAPRIVAGTVGGAARIDIGASEYDPGEPMAVISGAPSSAVQDNSASITIGGAGIVSYRYAVDGGAFSTEDTPVSTPISLSGLAGGRHAVAVIGRTATREQSSASASVAVWTVDSLPPTTTAVPGTGSYSSPQSVTLACNDTEGSGCAGTFYCLGGGCTPTIPYTGPITVSATSGLKYYSVDGFGHKEAVRTTSYTFVGTISGRVTDGGTGNGIAGAWVAVINASTGSFVTSASTDASGSYNISGVTGGSYKLSFDADGYIGQWYSNRTDKEATVVSVSAPAATTGIDAALVTAGKITGTVTGSDTGAGISRVGVTAYDAATNNARAFSTTDDSGNYTLSFLPPGQYHVRFTDDSYSGYITQWYGNRPDKASASVVTVTPSGTTTGVNASLVKGGTISGTVTETGTGAGLAYVNVRLYEADTGALVLSSGTDNLGRYSIVGLSGSYKIQFVAGGYQGRWYGGQTQAAAAVVTVEATKVRSGIDAVLVKGGSISGKVTDQTTGIALQQALIYAYDSTTGDYAGYAIADPAGNYTVSGLSSGSYKLSFSASGFITVWSGGSASNASAVAVAVTAPDTTSGVNAALLAGGTITGTVTDKVTGAPVSNFSVVAYDAATGSWAGNAYHTDSSGGYVISGLPSGSYHIRFSGDGEYLDQWYNGKSAGATPDQVQVTGGTAVSGIDCALEQGGAISGVVTDGETGLPLASASIQIATETGPWIDSDWTDASGRYRLSPLPTGPYRVSFSRAGYLQLDATVSVAAPASTPLDAPMARGGSITGMVTDRATGVGIGSVQLSVSGRHSSSSYLFVSENDGSFTITGLPSGSYRLQVYAGNGYISGMFDGQGVGDCAADISVTAPNATSGIEVRLDPGGSITGRITDTATSQGVVGAQVYVSSGPGGLFPSIATTAADGSYVLGGLATGNYGVSVSASGYRPSTSPLPVIVTAPGSVSGVNFSLSAAGGISGRVTDLSTGADVGNVTIVARDSVTGLTVARDITDPVGNYALTGLASGSYQLFYYPGYGGYYLGDGGYYLGDGGSSVGSATLSASLARRVSASLVPGWEAATNSLSTIQAAQSASVSIYPVEGAVPNSPAEPASSAVPGWGDFASSTSGTPAPVGTVAVTAPEVVTGINFAIDLLGTISGTVTDSSGKVIRNVHVTVHDSSTGTVAGTTSTKGDGTYHLSGLPTGAYRVKFEGPYYPTSPGGYLSRWYESYGAGSGTEVAVVSGQTAAGIDAQLLPGGAISGSVSVSGNACTAPGAVLVTAYDAADTAVASATVNPSWSNQFTLVGLPEGSYNLSIVSTEAGLIRQWHRNRNDAESADAITVTAGRTAYAQDVTLAAGGATISGKLAGDSGCTLTTGNVRLFDWYSGGFVAEAQVNGGGNYHLTGVADGSYRLRFTVNENAHWYKAAGETADATKIVVSGGAAVTGIDRTEVCGPDGTTGETGAATLLDALKALRIAVGLDVATPEAKIHYDLAPVVSGVSVPDGRIDVSDALVILRRVVHSAGVPGWM